MNSVKIDNAKAVTSMSITVSLVAFDLLDLNPFAKVSIDFFKYFAHSNYNNVGKSVIWITDERRLRNEFTS